jgi:hypothetical protein
VWITGRGELGHLTRADGRCGRGCQRRRERPVRVRAARRPRGSHVRCERGHGGAGVTRASARECSGEVHRRGGVGLDARNQRPLWSSSKPSGGT